MEGPHVLAKTPAHPNKRLSIEYKFGDAAEDNERKELLDILAHERIRTVFQPIISLRTAEVYGYEALSRITGPSPLRQAQDTIFKGPEALFQAAERHGLIAELEKTCRTTALKRACELGIDKKIFLNIYPSVIDQPNHESGITANLARKLFDRKDNIILELTEKVHVVDDVAFRKAVSYYRSQGFMIAIDDFGAGFAGLNTLLELEPQIVKVDRFLVTGIDRSARKRLLLESIVAFCHKVNARVVAEGIETKEELGIIIDMKVDFGQGYLLARPEYHLQECSKDVCEQIIGFNEKWRHGGSNHLSDSVGALVRESIPLSIEDTAFDALERLKDDQNLAAIPVVDKDMPVGIIHRDDFFYRIGQQYGFAVYIKRPVGHIMEMPLIFESTTAMDVVSLEILERDETKTYNPIVIVRNGIYAGVVHVRDILAGITEQKLNLAAQANPLTGLPGNVVIQNEITDRLKTNQLFSVLYLDLDNFKHFNDCFGFEKGDIVIRFLADMAKERIYRWDSKGFAGHIGGDDFIALCRPDGIEVLCEDIIRSFDDGIKGFHDEETVKRGYYKSANREGKVAKFPLLSLSVAVVSNNEGVFNSYAKLASVASEVKKAAKKTVGSSYYIDHRKSSHDFKRLPETME